MKIGVSKTIITPESRVDLAGFGRADRKAIGAHDDLYISTMIMEQDEKRAIIICADVLGFGDELAKNLKDNINKVYGFKEEEILLSASHTHSGPQTAPNMLEAVGVEDDQYIKFFKDKVISSIKAALDSMNEVDVYYGKTACNIGVNRRLLLNGVINFAPNENGVRDDEMIVLKFVKDDKVKAILYNYTCHPSTIDTDYVSADYPGKTRSVIENTFGDQVAVFFVQGCCGNIRIRTIKDGYFRAGTWDDVEYFGNITGKCVVDLCNSKMDKLNTSLSTKIADIKLPLEELPKKETLQKIMTSGNSHEKIWAEKMLSKYDSLKAELPFTIQRISLNNDFSIVAMSGEVCVEYGLYAKKMSTGKTPVVSAYCNGAPGYIPTAVMLEQGGYEPEGSVIYYSMPSRFKSDVEKIVLKSIDEIME